MVGRNIGNTDPMLRNDSHDLFMLFKGIFDSSPNATAFLDANDEFRVAYVNLSGRTVLESLQTQINFPVNSVLGRPISAVFVTPKLQKDALLRYESMPFSSTVQCGTETVEYSVAAVREQQGSFIGVSLLFSVTTTRARSAAQLEAASSEMQSAVMSIAANAQQAVDVAGTAMAMGDMTNATISDLGESSGEIGNVLNVIAKIASQTNLLALNATIEAARAGEFGKGFAVVASEVKDLATETAKATEAIASRITAIQGDIAQAATAISEMVRTVNVINDLQTSIAHAVEEQMANVMQFDSYVADVLR